MGVDSYPARKKKKEKKFLLFNLKRVTKRAFFLGGGKGLPTCLPKEEPLDKREGEGPRRYPGGKMNDLTRT